jgi:hypothetical protein
VQVDEGGAQGLFVDALAHEDQADHRGDQHKVSQCRKISEGGRRTPAAGKTGRPGGQRVRSWQQRSRVCNCRQPYGRPPFNYLTASLLCR